MSSLIKQLDFYGQTVDFTIEGSYKRKTVLGGYITLAVMAGLLGYGVFAFIDLVTNPYTWTIMSYTERLKQKKAGRVNIHEDSGFIENLQIIDAFHQFSHKVDRAYGHFAIMTREQGIEEWMPSAPCYDPDEPSAV